MLELLDQTLGAFLARTLEFDPALTRDDAIRRVTHLAEDAGLSGVDERLRRLDSSLVERGVVNPRWLFADDIRPRFFLANGRPGFLQQVIEDAERVRDGVSQYVVYGQWDSLLILYGSDEEADRLMTRLEGGAYERSARFAAQDVLLAYRHRVPRKWETVGDVSREDINHVALNYGTTDRIDLRAALLSAKVLLGRTVTFGTASPYPITAFVGITLRAREAISGPQVLETLMRQPDLRTCLVHLFQIQEAIPFHYFAKLACASVDELDKATNAIAFAQYKTVRFEGETVVVAHGADQLPLVRKPDIASLSVTPDISPIARTAQQVFDHLGPPERLSFNALPVDRQMATLRALAGLRESAESSSFDGPTRQRIESALSTFARESTAAGGPNLTGAVVEVTTMVEGLARRFLSKLAYGILGNNPALIQQELQLPTKHIRQLSLGRVVQALRVAGSVERFQSVREYVPDEWVVRLAGFADERNTWAHDSANGAPPQLIDQAYAAMRDGITIAGWLTEATSRFLLEQRQIDYDAADDSALRLSRRQPGAGVRVFVSHATADDLIARRLAMGLQAVGYRSWYAEWELKGGDSIVRKIQDALSESDVLIVVLSQKSVTSQWVQREMDSMLMQQLSGARILIIPVLIDDTEIPVILRTIKYVDLRRDFEEGFTSLLDALRHHRRQSAEIDPRSSENTKPSEQVDLPPRQRSEEARTEPL